MNEDKNIEVRIEKDKWECHACGKIGKGFKQIWLTFLCQHFISLCPKCEIEFKQSIDGRMKSNKIRAKLFRHEASKSLQISVDFLNQSVKEKLPYWKRWDYTFVAYCYLFQSYGFLMDLREIER